MIRIATGFFVLLTIAAPALAGDAAWNGARTLLFEPEKYGSYPDDLVMKAGAYIGAPEPLCRGGARTPCWLETENQPGCHLWNPNPQPNETVTWSGACVEAKASGQGRVVWRYGGGTTTCEGGLIAGNANGWGTCTMPNGDRYEGEWRDSELHGRATFTGTNGDRYEGDWRDNKKHGRGTYTWSRGDRYEGDWRDNKKHGRGTYTWPAGNSETCEWRNNEVVKGTCRKH